MLSHIPQKHNSPKNSSIENEWVYLNRSEAKWDGIYGPLKLFVTLFQLTSAAEMPRAQMNAGTRSYI